MHKRSLLVHTRIIPEAFKNHLNMAFNINHAMSQTSNVSTNMRIGVVVIRYTKKQ